jgi:hypothetical protein
MTHSTHVPLSELQSPEAWESVRSCRRAHSVSSDSSTSNKFSRSGRGTARRCQYTHALCHLQTSPAATASLESKHSAFDGHACAAHRGRYLVLSIEVARDRRPAAPRQRGTLTCLGTGAICTLSCMQCCSSSDRAAIAPYNDHPPPLPGGRADLWKLSLSRTACFNPIVPTQQARPDMCKPASCVLQRNGL